MSRSSGSSSAGGPGAPRAAAHPDPGTAGGAGWQKKSVPPVRSH